MVFVNDVGSLFYTHMYKFDVHYCMRLHEIEVTYDQVLKLNESLSKELLILPDFPEEYSTDRCAGCTVLYRRPVCCYAVRISALHFFSLVRLLACTRVRL